MARVCYHMPQEQSLFPSLFSNRSSMTLFIKESLVPILIEIFKDLDCDICLESYTGLRNNPTNDWSIRSVEFNFHMQSECGKCYIAFGNCIIVTIDVKTAGYRDVRTPKLPGSDDIIKSVLKYNKNPIIFPYTSPELLLDTFAFFNDIDGVEAVLGAYESVIGADSIDCALDILTKKEEVNGELVAWLLEFKKQHFGFDSSQDLPVL